MAGNTLIFEKEGNTAIVTINRPRYLNALNKEVLDELSQVIDEVSSDEEIHVVILTGAGGKAFVAGADIAYMQNMTALEGRAFGRLGQSILRKLEYMPRPVIAAINGYALGGGCELAMACDIRVASDKSQFGQPEVSLGVIAGFAGTQRLPRLIGKSWAKELLFTGDMINAQEAYRIGLVNRVVPEEKLMEVCRELANKIISKGQVAVRLCKAAVDEGLEMDVDKAMTHEADLFGLCFATQDQREGMTAFLEKRKPKFIGK